ncbi:MAG: ATP-binding protein [Burkholderiales bacterium]|jgi:signal transduction histidine kinase|nr:ATP-binding protein [Burkholderiales bacterium]
MSTNNNASKATHLNAPVDECFTVEDNTHLEIRNSLAKALKTREIDAQSRLLQFLIPVAIFGASADIFVSLFLREAGSQSLTPMAQSNLIAVALLVISAIVFKWRGLSAGKVTFYAAVLMSFAGHAFWVGFGLSTPGLSFLALLIIQEALGPRNGNVLRSFAIATALLVATIATAQMGGFIQVVSVPLQHQLVVTSALFVSAFLLGRSALESRSAILEKSVDDTFKQIVLNKNLKEALEARNSFFSAVSHEIRTPLHGINSAVTLVNHPRTSTEAKHRYMRSINKSVSDLTKIIDDVLDLSRLESGGFKLNTSPLDLKELCTQQINFFKATTEEKGIQLHLNLRSERPEFVMADGLRLRQMMSNLLTNAIKFTSAGSIVLDVEALSQDKDKTIWRFSVTDTGCGIAPETLGKLFKPFSQAENQAYSDQTGSGLGLSIVSGLAKQMSGVAGVSSELGAGASFWFTVQLEDVAVA